MINTSLYYDARSEKSIKPALLYVFSVITEELRTCNQETGLIKCRIRGLQKCSVQKKKETRISKAEIQGFQENVGFKAKRVKYIFIKAIHMKWGFCSEG